MLSYVIVSPVKDEQEYLARTVASVAKQTIIPEKWVIVDDGSSDSTPEILQHYAKQFPWILIKRIERTGERDLGVTEIRAYTEGYQLLGADVFDLVVKLDCDLELPADYFEKMIVEFEKRPRLGIASGVYLENHDGAWLPIEMPQYHAAGASKVVRRQCLTDIGGFALHRGWDTIDEIKALANGWETMHFPHIQFYHLRCEGAAMGARRTNLLHGEVYYVSGGGALFMALKVLDRCINGRPRIIGGLAMLWGYGRCVLAGKPRGVRRNEAQFYRRMLNERLRAQVLRHTHAICRILSVRGGK